MLHKIFLMLICLLISWKPILASEILQLRKNLQRAVPGDYLVISSNKTDTLMHIYDKQDDILTIEEIAIPDCRKPKQLSWKKWVEQYAPGNTSWVMYEINLQTGRMIRYYSFSKNDWYAISDADNFLSTLLNLKLSPIPQEVRKKIGPKPKSGPDWRPIWQPRMIVNGSIIKDVRFNAWRTRWPKDGSELSGKMIEIYLPVDNQQYPSYFPYWLQVNGVIGKAKIRIIDSGTQLISPKSPLSALNP
ncbi:hypothetical protein [Candidatus Protochlamydia sp. W-9]|uniref:hypothetical protein n=1 Tax=Candidatus Protochlamydia sp. W-9 TaxID=1785087 RepID=UPI00096A6AB7|nr:hypothetical protein [Candidatus Protochlamydia sp. W-9]